MSSSHNLAYPFVVCQSQGGPYADEPFVAGVQLGQIDQALKAAAAVPHAFAGLLGSNSQSFTCYSALARQLELVGMAHGYPNVVVTPIGGGDDHDAMPNWCRVTFTRAAAGYPG